jgi:type VI secretion system protein ImpG
LARHDAPLERALSREHVALFCAPAINLFPRAADRVALTDREYEYHVVADRTRPTDFEVHSVVGVTGFGATGEVRRSFSPLYTCRDKGMRSDGAFFTVHRAPRLVSRGPGAADHTGYCGAEVFVSLVDGTGGPYRADLRQLGVDTLCTNRDLPLRLLSDGVAELSIESGAPVRAARCIAGPSSPRAAHASGSTAWRLVSHLSLNYTSLTDDPQVSGACALRELLGLYADLSDTSTARQIQGLLSAVGRPVVRRLPLPGPPCFGRGVEVTLECDERAFEGGSAVLLGLVVGQLLTRYASINSFTETVLRSRQRGEIARWPPALGCRPTL